MPHGVVLRGVWSLWVGGCAAVLLATAPAAEENSAFERLSVEQGLSQASVAAILQDRHGFLWFGTQYGLNRYDGYGLRVFKQQADEPGSLSDNWITALLEGRDGQLWVGTRNGGLNRYDDSTERFAEFRHRPGISHSLSDDGVLALWSDPAGTLWVGTTDGLNRYRGEGERFSVFRIPEGTPAAQRINALQGDSGGIWLGTGAGLYRFDTSSERFEAVPLPGTPEVAALTRDASGQLWVGTVAGLYRLDPASKALRSFSDAAGAGLADQDIRSLYIDRAGHLWIGTFAAGLARFDVASEKFQRYQHDPADRYSLSDARVVSLYQDRSGSLWAGTWHGGVSHMDLDSGRFSRFGSRPGAAGGLSDKRVLAIAGDDGDVLWLGTVNGLNRLDLTSGRVDSYLAKPSPGELSHGHVLAVAIDSHGSVWAGTKDGLNRLDPDTGRFTVYRHDAARADSLSDSYVSAILPEADGSLWLGTWDGGLNHFEPTSGTARIHSYTAAGTPRSERINALYRDSDGGLWIATAGDGLVHFDPITRRFRIHAPDQRPGGLPHSRVHSVLRDSRGWLWIGTAGGLARSQSPVGAPTLTFRTYTSRDGLAGDAIGGVLEDDAGRLWISTVQGISRFDPKTERFSNYGHRDGVLASGYYIKSCYRNRNGQMFFGGSEGLSAFHPDQIWANPHPALPVLTGLLIANRPQGLRVREPHSPLLLPIHRTASLELPYQQAAVTLEFSALHYADASRNQYAYRLDGYDPDWVATDATNRRATYTNLDPGHYRFRVKATNKDGLWGTQEARLALTILPPFWMTWWFRIALGTLVVGAGLIFYRMRIRSLERAHDRLEAEVAVRTAELRSLAAQLAEANAHLEETSLTDPLTGLKNRRFLVGHLEQDLALAVRQYSDAGKPNHHAPEHADLVFFLIDCDHFKTVNDTYGHKAGDRLLASLAELLRKLFRESDYLVRWGGEEFLIVMRFVDRADAMVVAERLRVLVAQHEFRLNADVSIHKTCSIGFAAYPFIRDQPEAVSWTRVVDIADLALYCAKRSGRNAWVGFAATAKTRPKRLVTRLTQAPEAELARDEICVHSSLPAEALRWTAEA